MKVALIADLHFGCKKSDTIFQESQLRFFKEQFVPELKQKKIDTIIVCGDIFDTRFAVNVQTENVVLDLFKETFKDFTVHVVVGNHDIFHTTTTEVNSLKALDLLPNVTVYEKPTEVMFGEQKVMMLPWIVDYADFNQVVLDKYKYAFAHLDIISFDIGGGRLSEGGLTIQDVISKFQHTYTGHYHCRSRREYIDGQTITYIGSPYQITRIDKNQERGYGILDLDTNNFKWYNNSVSMKFNVFTYPIVDRTKVTGNVVDIHVPYEYQNETKKIYDLVHELGTLLPAYPINTFNDPKPENEDSNVQVNTANFNMLNLFTDYLNQIESALPPTLTKAELYDELVSLYNTFKGNEA